MSTLPTIEELQEQLREAEDKSTATMATIESAGSEIDAEVLADLETAFEEETAEVQRIAAAIERREKLRDAKAKVPIPSNDGAPTSGRGTTTEQLTYRRNGPNSFFVDVWSAGKGGHEAQARLQRHAREMAVERRDLSSTATAGGDFLPPLYLADQWAPVARAGRPFADAVGGRPMPETGSSFTVPKVSTGAAAAIQTADNAAVQETDAVTATVTFGVKTIAGQQDISQQAFERTEPGLDEVLFADLGADYAMKLDTQLLNGSNGSGQVKGLLQDGNINSVTFTAATPTAALFYPKLADAVQRIWTNRFAAPDAIFMHPRRWGWLLASLDSQNRPLITPYAPVNALARFDSVAPEAVVGSMMGLTVFTDANIPSTNGAGTNEDIVIVTRLADNLFYESGTPRVRVFEEVLSGNLTVRISVYGYIAYTSERYSKGHSKITGTGLVSPTF